MNEITVVIGKGNIERETEKAMQFDLGLGLVWLPKSQIKIEWDTRDGITESCRTAALTMPYWLAKKNGLTRRPSNSMAW